MKKVKIKKTKKKKKAIEVPVVVPVVVDKEQEKINRIIPILAKKISEFKKTHKTYIVCRPYGRRGLNKDGIETAFILKRNIYVCKTDCCRGHRLCKEFKLKVFLCHDLHCNNFPICFSSTEKKLIAECKRVGHWDERVGLEKIYEKFLLLNKFSRGFSTNPKRTLPYFEKYLEISKKKSKKK